MHVRQVRKSDSREGVRRVVPTAWLLAVLCWVMIAPLRGAAQDLPAAFGRFDPSPDFLFEAPRFSLGLRGGVFFHRAAGDLFDFTEERFTVARSDFRAPSFGVEGSLWLGPRWEVTASLDGSRVKVHSEYRDWVEDDGTEDGAPIQQSTRITEGPMFAVGGRWFLFDRGEQIGQFAWVPRSWNAFVGAGGGVMGYGLELAGDFVAEADSSISTQDFKSSGNAFFPFVSGGVEVGLSNHATFVLEGRYLWGSEDLNSNFEDFVDPLDLSGARVTAGLYLRH